MLSLHKHTAKAKAKENREEREKKVETIQFIGPSQLVLARSTALTRRQTLCKVGRKSNESNS